MFGVNHFFMPVIIKECFKNTKQSFSLWLFQQQLREEFKRRVFIIDTIGIFLNFLQPRILECPGAINGKHKYLWYNHAEDFWRLAVSKGASSLVRLPKPRLLFPHSLLWANLLLLFPPVNPHGEACREKMVLPPFLHPASASITPPPFFPTLPTLFCSRSQPSLISIHSYEETQPVEAHTRSHQEQVKREGERRRSDWDPVLGVLLSVCAL